MKFGVNFTPIATILDYVEMENNSGQIKLVASTFPVLRLRSMFPPLSLKLYYQFEN